MLEIPTNFMVKRKPGSNPTEVYTKFRFFNESNDTADAEAYGSQMGMSYQAVGVLPTVAPHSGTEAYQQFPPIDDPRHFMVIIHRNGEPLGPFYFVHMDNNVSILEVTMFVDPATHEVEIEIGGRDDGDNPIPWQSYP